MRKSSIIKRSLDFCVIDGGHKRNEAIFSTGLPLTVMLVTLVAGVLIVRLNALIVWLKGFGSVYHRPPNTAEIYSINMIF